MRDPDDVDAGEAEAQREETIMPWVWGVFGLVLIAIFVAWVIAVAPHGHVIRHPPGAAPTFRPLNRGY